MKHKLEIWYLVSDGGDGSAYPTFYESKECTELADELSLLRGSNFAETCNGYLEFESDSPITCKDKITTLAELHTEMRDYIMDKLDRKISEKNRRDDLLEIAENNGIDLTFNPETD